MSPVLVTQIVARVIAVVQVTLGILVWTGHGVLALVWSVGMPVFGLVQTNLLPGGAHAAVQVLHLVVGLAAVGLVENLAGRSRRREEAMG
jgi:hypothetical protein